MSPDTPRPPRGKTPARSHNRVNNFICEKLQAKFINRHFYLKQREMIRSAYKRKSRAHAGNMDHFNIRSWTGSRKLLKRLRTFPRRYRNVTISRGETMTHQLEVKSRPKNSNWSQQRMDYCSVPKTFFSFFLYKPSNKSKSIVRDIVIGRNGFEYHTQLEIHD